MNIEAIAQLVMTVGLPGAAATYLIYDMVTGRKEREKQQNKIYDLIRKDGLAREDRLMNQVEKFGDALHEFKEEMTEFRGSINNLNSAMDGMNKRLEQVENKLDN